MGTSSPQLLVSGGTSKEKKYMKQSTNIEILDLTLFLYLMGLFQQAGLGVATTIWLLQSNVVLCPEYKFSNSSEQHNKSGRSVLCNL